MDPDAALASIRNRIRWMRDAIDSGNDDVAIAEADLLATEFEGLDRMARGGFLPKDWRK